MESNDKVEEVDIKTFTFYHFDDIIRFRGINLVIFYWTKNQMKIL